MYPSKSPSLLNHDVLTLCFGLSILGRRALTGTSPNKLTNPNGMLSGIHALLKNDIRIGNPKDEWVFQDMEILKEVSGSGLLGRLLGRLLGKCLTRIPPVAPLLYVASVPRFRTRAVGLKLFIICGYNMTSKE